MEKLLKKEALSFFISEIFITLAAVFCTIVPLFSETYVLIGRKAVVGYVLFCSSFLSTIILYYSKQRYRIAIMCRYIYDSYNQWLFDLDNSCKAGIITKEETKKRMEKLRCVTEWTFNFDSLARLFVWFDILAIIAMSAISVSKMYLEKSFFFSYMYGISTFFLFMQLIWFYIISKHIIVSVYTWLKSKQLLPNEFSMDSLYNGYFL